MNLNVGKELATLRRMFQDCRFRPWFRHPVRVLPGELRE